MIFVIYECAAITIAAHFSGLINLEQIKKVPEATTLGHPKIFTPLGGYHTTSGIT